MSRGGRRAVLAATLVLPGAARAQPAAPSAAPIGTARMEPDRTIVLDLIARQGGAMGDARLAYPPGHRDYDMILRHLGGLRPGETKPLPPFP
ncbi:hypothetical protein GXW74_17090 [Roseomonas eburnea]|uniref:Uncharacterized protein n=1 Tax=Neoroseomonas eburnea TaxID=1346889 RepID=A0A9X9XES4_9PROT|nr:hypothetical protein [Neoroseomonas eburnea]MBR0682210.1 hypothetical protein [Neoroseomonas eburnea]